ncbi:MAG TPA: phosphatidate cytidylyltransferase [Candidatus Dorea gallistercoris]|uniref:Phosphatidate cytidylyltransferase n=1 Tax=Candidatus Dorea gallistercoris TaxID=2838542 RepID=A0A9D1R759_9FIRM|nr:phosphatidate cytidylyltransferase [Candidatus Dorea gallistercoris]
MFKTRLLSGIILVIVLILTVGYGGNLLFGLLAVVSLIGMSELYKVVDVQKKVLGMAGYLAAAAYYAVLYTGSMEHMTMVFILSLILIMGIYVFAFPEYQAEQAVTVFFGLFYVAVMLSYIYQTRMLPEGGIVVWLIFLSSWGCDTCAYCVGMLIGKHKMAPKLSPKKSVEGGVGGVLGAALLGVLFALAMNHWGGEDVNALHYAVICGVGGIISQVGDLAASAIKRNHDIKDYGRLIPGHGGILDRFDSVIFTAPVIYYLATALGGTL